MSDLRGEGVRIDRHILLDYKLSLLSKNCGGSSIGEKKREINYPKKIPARGGTGHMRERQRPPTQCGGMWGMRLPNLLLLPYLAVWVSLAVSLGAERPANDPCTEAMTTV